jgi:hypothetical protein
VFDGGQQDRALARLRQMETRSYDVKLLNPNVRQEIALAPCCHTDESDESEESDESVESDESDNDMPGLVDLCLCCSSPIFAHITD